MAIDILFITECYRFVDYGLHYGRDTFQNTGKCFTVKK